MTNQLSEKTTTNALGPLRLPKGITVRAALQKVLKLAINPLDTPLANNAVVTLYYLDINGVVTARVEKPIYININPEAAAKLAVGKALASIALIGGVDFKYIKYSTSFILSEENHNESLAVNKAFTVITNLMLKLGIESDDGFEKTAIALVSSGNCNAHDIKISGENNILFIDVSEGRARLGNSTLARAYDQTGNVSPDLDRSDYLVNVFQAIQILISEGLILSGIDISYGGLITSLCQMAVAGKCGIKVSMEVRQLPHYKLFAEEVGLLIEISDKDLVRVCTLLDIYQITFECIGHTTIEKEISIICDSKTVLSENTDTIESWRYMVEW